MITVTLNYGLSKTTQVLIEPGETVRQALTDTAKAILGLPENVQPTINGDTVSLDNELFSDTVVTFERQAAQKAS